MTKKAIKKNFWVLAFSGFLAFLLVPTDSFAQSRQITKRGANDTYQRAKVNRTTVKRDYTNRTRNTTATKSTAKRSVAKRDYRERTRATTPTRSTNRATSNRGYATKNRSTATANSRATTATRNGTTVNRGNRVNNGRYAKESVERNSRSNYAYRTNERNDYCNNYYRGINNWNRTFWTSIHYTPNYYDLTYNRFPSRNGIQSQRFRFFGERYWLYDGIWFKKRFGSYHAVDAPTGICLDVLPIGGEMIWYRGDKFVIYRGTAYKMLPFGGFQVVQMLGRF